MVLESTMICVDNSDYMRNADFVPTRMQAQYDAVNILTRAKLRSHPENNVGLLSMADNRVLVTLTTDANKIMSKLHYCKPNGAIDLVRGVKVANLALKHRQSKNHKTRIVIFVASPVKLDQSEFIKLAKRLKKEKVNVDIVNFGEEESNNAILGEFVNTLNGKEGTSSHLVSISAPSVLSDALLSSSMFQGEDSAIPHGFSNDLEGLDDDPELAMALRISMEESRIRQETEKKSQNMETEASQQQPGEDLLQQALALSLSNQDEKSKAPDFSSMTEEEQLNYALQMSMTSSAGPSTSSKAASDKPTPVDTEMKEEEDYDKAMKDEEFLQSILSSLPGVDPNSEAVRSAFEDLKQNKNKEKEEKK